MQRDVNPVSAMILDLGHCKEVQEGNKGFLNMGTSKRQCRADIECLKNPNQVFLGSSMTQTFKCRKIIIIITSNSNNNNQKERVSHLKPSFPPSLQPISWQKKFLNMHQES